MVLPPGIANLSLPESSQGTKMFEDNAPDSGNATPSAPSPTPPVAPPSDAGAPSPVSNMPASAPPIGAPAVAPSPAAPSRSFMGALAHALIGSTMSVATHSLSALAGPQAPDSYQTDADGKMTPVYRQKDNSRDRIARIAMHAMEGLAAGSQVPQQKSGAASALAGIGAGASNEINQAKQEDLLKRQQSKEQFEAEQQALTSKYVRAQHNITTHALWQKGLEDANEHDPERSKTEAIRGATEDYISKNPSTTMTGQVLSETEAKALQAADKNNPASTTHAFFPYGMREVKENGQTVYEKDGVTPKKEGQVYVIGGGVK